MNDQRSGPKPPPFIRILFLGGPAALKSHEYKIPPGPPPMLKVLVPGILAGIQKVEKYHLRQMAKVELENLWCYVHESELERVKTDEEGTSGGPGPERRGPRGLIPPGGDHPSGG